MKLVALLMAILLTCVRTNAAIDQNTLEQLLPVANRGNAEAQYHVGMMYNNGIGGASKDPKLAFDWFLKSATGKDPLGAYKAGCYYADGMDVSTLQRGWCMTRWSLAATASLCQSRDSS